MGTEIKLTAKDIYHALRLLFHNHNYSITNSYIFESDWESDFFSVTKSGYAQEVEVKVSRSDFRKDFQKDKHLILSRHKLPIVVKKGVERSYSSDPHGHYIEDTGKKVYCRHTMIEFIHNNDLFIPNRFYYACPDGIIKIDECPKYAGLIYVKSTFEAVIVKQAPFLHKRFLFSTQRLASILMRKFYYKMLELQYQLNREKSKNIV